MIERLVEFAFIPALALAMVAGGLVGLFVVGALFDALDHPDELKSRIEMAFRRPPAKPRIAGKEHYYRAYWNSHS